MNVHVVFYILPIGQTCANYRALVSDTFWFGEAWVTKYFPGGAEVKNLPLMQEEQETQVQTQSSILAWKTP